MKPRIRFHWRKGNTGSQLIWKSSIPALFLLIIISLVVYISSSRLQRELTRQLFEDSSEITFRAMNRIYEPLLNTLKISSLWVQIGGINDLGDITVYEENLKSMIREDSLIQSMTLKDMQGDELDVITVDQKDIILNYYESDNENSLRFQREAEGLTYTNIYEKRVDDTIVPRNFSPLKLSRTYTLPYLKEEGITIYYRLYSDKDRYLELWMDFSLKHLASMISDYSLNRESVIFILLDEDEFVTYSINDLLRFRGLKSSTSSSDATENSHDLEIIQAIYNHIKDSDSKTNGITRINLGDESWWTQYNTLHMLENSIIMGSYTPESTLLISRIQSPLLIISIILLIFIGFYFFFLFDDYRKVLKDHLSTSEEDRIKSEIALGENLYCEFKSSLRWDYREEAANKTLETVILKSISAFNNSDGGVLFIGVMDDGSILGLENDYSCLKEPGKDYFELHLRNLLSTMFGVAYPVSHIKVDFPEIEGKEICRIKIRKGEEPLYLISNEKGSGKTEKFFVRSGNSSRQISSIKEISTYIMNRFR